MNNSFTKISLFILITLILSSCSSTKRVPQGKHLLVKNNITINGRPTQIEEIANLPYQKPNSTLLGFRFRLKIYGLANLKPDTIYKPKTDKNTEKNNPKLASLSKKQKDKLVKSFWNYGWHEFLKKTGEPPVILDPSRAKKTTQRLQNYFFERGFFDVKVTFKIDTVSSKKAKINYDVQTGRAYVLDSISKKINSPILDSIYNVHKAKSFLKKQQYHKTDFDKETNRLTSLYRNNGIFHFQPNYINYDIDTVETNKKTNIFLKINNRTIRVNDSTKTEPFEIFKVNKVNVYIDPNATKNNEILKDSVVFQNVSLFSAGKLKYDPKSITDGIFISKNSLFSDEKTTQTKNYLSNLEDFTYPTIVYKVDKKNKKSLIADVYLNQKKKYKFVFEPGATRSNIQEFGLTGNGSFTIRNLFHGAETLKIAARGNVGTSNDFANPNNEFFNVSEYGVDVKLSFPRLLFPIKIAKWIPKTMIPTTAINVGFAKQRNIGLDKENLTGSLVYNWIPSANTNLRLDLINIQFVKNVNTANYFNVYKSSFDRLNEIAQPFLTLGTIFKPADTADFINKVFDGTYSLTAKDFSSVRSIEERRKRLTQNDLIFATSIIYSKSTRQNIDDNDFYIFKTKLETAGNLLTLLVNEKDFSETGNNTVFGVAYSQYFKSELDYIKRWDLRGKKVLAVRSFFGIALPYGNSNSIPFSRSYFAGGANDNRAWQPYSLGPGRSGALNDFNEANLKIALSAELRFGIFNKLNGAIFADAGNIWNVLDNITEEQYVFSGLKSLNDIALGTGFGFRYDLNYFVVRLDLGFKTYDPAKDDTQKWFRDYNYANSVINIGINYPF